MAPTKTELTLYQIPIVNNLNGVTAVEKVYPATEPKRVRKFTDSDIGLLNGLYSAREGNDYVWRVGGVMEEFERRTGRNISRSSLYRHVNQTRKSRSRALVLATPTNSAIGVYNNSSLRTLMPAVEQPLPTRNISPSQLLEESQKINTPDGMNNLYEGLIGDENLESSLVEVRDMQMRLARGRMQFEKNKGNLEGMGGVYMLANMWFDYHLWVDRLPEGVRETYTRVFTPAYLFLQQVLLEEYNLAFKKSNEKPNVFQRGWRILAGHKQH